MTKESIAESFQSLQDRICQSLERIDGKSKFQEDLWTRPDGGGGRTRTIGGEGIIEKGGVNFSEVYGTVTDLMKKNTEIEGDSFFATGVSIVIHPHSPHIPIIHMNIRYFELNNGRYWFGGGIDLTPHYIVSSQAQKFHAGLKAVCDKYNSEFYTKFKSWADDYFFLPHRNETRGVGGIFFDHLKEDEHNSKEKLLSHIKNGAKKVIVSAPCKNADKTIVYGVNENILTKDDQIISAASCTTNCLAPVANVLNERFEIEKGFMTTIHAFTSDQRILDNSHKDPRRARSASQSIVPTSTGASKAIGEIIPSLKGKLEGVAMRVPTPNVSLIELVFCTKKEMTKEKINEAFTFASKKQSKKVLEITTEKLVSVDFNHNSASAIIDSSLTNVVGGNMGKISAWYDNEWGFSNRMCDIAEHLHKIS